MFCKKKKKKGVNLHCHPKEEVLLGCWSTACGCHVRQSCAGGDRFGRYQDVGLGGRRWEKGHKLDSNQVTIFLIALHGGSIVAVVTFEATVRATDSFNAWAIVDRGCYLLSGQERKLWIAWSACLSSRLWCYLARKLFQAPLVPLFWGKNGQPGIRWCY